MALWVYVILIIILGISLTSIKIIVYWMAKNDKFFTEIREGEVRVIIHGGRPKKFLMSLRGFHLNAEYYVVPDSDKSRIERGSIDISIDWFFGTFLPGITWLGLPNVAWIYEYRFTWSKWDSQKKEIITHDEKIKQLFVQVYQYVFVLKDSETFSMVTVTIPFFVNIRVINPDTALFKNTKWLDIVQGAILDEARSYLATFSDPNQLMELSKGEDIQDEKLKAKLPREKAEKGKEGEGALITSFGKIIYHRLKEKGRIERKKEGEWAEGTLEKGVGAQIMEIDVPQIDFGDYAATARLEQDAKKAGEAAIMKAKLEAEAAVATAKGGRDSQIIRAQGAGVSLWIKTQAERDSYRVLVDEFGNDFVLGLKLIEVYANTAKEGTNLVLGTDMITDVMKRLGGTSGKAGSNVFTPKDLETALGKSAESKGLDSQKVLGALRRIAEQTEVIDSEIITEAVIKEAVTEVAEEGELTGW
ncbi:MAG: hypothetical protein PHX30_02630 [Candidatus Pacebacteria bacterium]|nr:hypothetical protein [Candidatus Paceibacterota bacterium]